MLLERTRYLVLGGHRFTIEDNVLRTSTVATVITPQWIEYANFAYRVYTLLKEFDHFVYLCGGYYSDIDLTLYKIGYSTDPLTRYVTAGGHELYALMGFDTRHTALKAETALLGMFHEKRYKHNYYDNRREWFRLTPDDVAYIKGL